ncbi:hypothetical protein [Actinoplanes derwentensis]|uniref:hypothetical protein n=1 Tax=Actinoplanes derwentensis TaxID=113562 RepID=UPI001E2CFA42|nr:hypothetical protein [Actinoplanes derwentensis]
MTVCTGGGHAGGLDHVPDETPFAGQLFLNLAREGRLVLDADAADELLARLERSLGTVLARLEAARRWNGCGHDRDPPLHDYVVDGVFIEQIAPGWLDQAADELPRYIAALRLARRPAAARKTG